MASLADPEAFDVGTLDVGEGHRLHVAQHGARDGRAVLVLHGGPGSGASPALARPFAGPRWRVVLPDQRGAGLSTPHGGLEANDTARLVADCERLRRHLGIRRWTVAGGSWGATLAALYAAAYPDAVEALVLRAMFLAERRTVEAFLAPLGSAASLFERLDTIGAGTDGTSSTGAGSDGGPAACALHPGRQALDVAAAWLAHERQACGLPPAPPPDEADAARLVRKYRLQARYLAHDCFLPEGAVLRACERLPPVPTVIVHGLEDRVCPPADARRVLARAPHARLLEVGGAGHDPHCAPMAAAMRRVADTLADEAPEAGPRACARGSP